MSSSTLCPSLPSAALGDSFTDLWVRTNWKHGPAAGAAGPPLIYWQLFRGRVESVSAWEDEAALRRFVALPFHRETMRTFRDRGSLRSVEWSAGSFDLGAAFREGQRVLDRARPA